MKSFLSLVLWTILTTQFVANEAAFGVIRWNKRSGEFEPIAGLPTYDVRTGNSLQSRQEETHNFNGQHLHLTYYQELGFVHFYENDTKVSGIYGDMWTTLSEMLNFTLIVKRGEVMGVSLHNGSYNGILEDARLNRTDIIPRIGVLADQADAVRFTPSFWLNHYRTFAYGQWKRDRSWVFKQFSVEFWFLIFVFILILSVGSLAMQRMLMRYRQPMPRTSFVDHLFDTFATICNQGDVLDYPSFGFKILTVTVSTFSWLILVGFGARLMYSMAHEEFVAPYTDLLSLYEHTNIHVVVKNGTLSHVSFTNTDNNSIYDRITRAKRVTVVTNVEELINTVCLNSNNYVLLDGDDEVNVMNARNAKVCNVLPANTKSISIPIASGISKRVENKRSLDIGVLKLREFGITNAIKHRYYSLGGDQSFERQTDSLAIDLNQFSLILAVLTVGIVVSVVICIAENIFFTLKKRSRNRRLLQLQRFSEVEQSFFDRTLPAGNYSPNIERPRNHHFLGGRTKIFVRPFIRDV